MSVIILHYNLSPTSGIPTPKTIRQLPQLLRAWDELAAKDAQIARQRSDLASLQKNLEGAQNEISRLLAEAQKRTERQTIQALNEMLRKAEREKQFLMQRLRDHSLFHAHSPLEDVVLNPCVSPSLHNPLSIPSSLSSPSLTVPHALLSPLSREYSRSHSRVCPVRFLEISHRHHRCFNALTQPNRNPAYADDVLCCRLV